MDKNLALRIKKIREYRNYTQTYIADKLNVSQNAYSKMENAITLISTERLMQIAKILEVSAEYILDDNFELFYVDKKATGKDNNLSQMQHAISLLQDEVYYLREQNQSLIRALERRI